MSSKRLDTIADYNRHGYRLRIDCGCGRVSVLDPLPIIALFSKRGWPRDMASIQARLKCERCGARPARIGPAWKD